MDAVTFFLNYILSTILVLSLIIFVHEWGHFAVARFYKIRIKTFSIGFGKELWGYTDKKGTRWKICLFPLGGFVDQDDSPSIPVHRRIQVALAGPAMNILLAYILLMFAYMELGVPRYPHTITGLNLSGGAYKAGVQLGDEVLEINGQEIPARHEDLRQFINDMNVDEVVVKLLRSGEEKEIKVNLFVDQVENDFGNEENKKFLGILLAGNNFSLKQINSIDAVPVNQDSEIARAILLQKMGKIVEINYGKEEKDRLDFKIYIDPALNTKMTIKESKLYDTLVVWDRKNLVQHKLEFIPALSEANWMAGRIISTVVGGLYQLMTGKESFGSLGGTVKAGQLTGDVVSQIPHNGMFYIVRLVAFLSMNMGLANLIPLPVLDGGAVSFYIVEWIRGKPLSYKAKAYVYGGFGILLIWAMFMINLHDILEILELDKP